MKKLILIFFLFSTFPLSSFCQQLALEDIVALYKKDLEGANEFLKSKGWESVDKREDGSAISSHDWAYMYNPTSKTSEEWVSRLYDKGEYFCFTYSFGEPGSDYISKGVKALKLKLVSSGVLEDGVLYSEYLGADYSLRIIINLKEEENINYKVGVVSKKYLAKTSKG